MRMENITLSRKQQIRSEVITRVKEGRLSKQAAADRLEITRRQMDNVLHRYEEEGLKSLVHGNTGQVPGWKTPSAWVETIVTLADKDGKYSDFSIPHMSEMLQENEGICIGRSTLDRVLKANGVRQVRKGKRGVYRKRRQRSSAEGWMPCASCFGTQIQNISRA